MLIVEDWAEIRRLRRSEGVSISEKADVAAYVEAHRGEVDEHCRRLVESGSPVGQLQSRAKPDVNPDL